ncbi:MAG: DivIVA domain-containing protein [Clostridiales bacterium]|nr:DivIVA domain-containing protein [Clostridiales bacterium]
MGTTPIKIPFATQSMGYDRSQVDRYVQKLADEYRSLQLKFKVLSERFEKTESLAASRSGDAMDVGTQAISKAMVDAEVKAIEIVAEAKNEASKVVDNAHAELANIQRERERVVAEVSTLMNRLRDVMPTASGKNA